MEHTYQGPPANKEPPDRWQQLEWLAYAYDGEQRDGLEGLLTGALEALPELDDADDFEAHAVRHLLQVALQHLRGEVNEARGVAVATVVHLLRKAGFAVYVPGEDEEN